MFVDCGVDYFNGSNLYQNYSFILKFHILIRAATIKIRTEIFDQKQSIVPVPFLNLLHCNDVSASKVSPGAPIHILPCCLLANAVLLVPPTHCVVWVSVLNVDCFIITHKEIMQ